MTESEFKLKLTKSYYRFWTIVFTGMILVAAVIFNQAKRLRKQLKLWEVYSTRFLANTSSVDLPSKLDDLPFGEDEGIIFSVKTLDIQDAYCPYNGSIIEKDDGNFLIAYRYDTLLEGKKAPNGSPFYSHIAITELDQNLMQVGKSQVLQTDSLNAEDPRLFYANNKLYVSYNDSKPPMHDYRSIRVAAIADDMQTLTFRNDLDLGLGKIEKNWVPFALRNEESNTESICFEYSVNPQHVIQITNEETCALKFPDVTPTPNFQELNWSDEWGRISGGTPARLIDGEYLAFFHSRFFSRHTGKSWYVMGAYTFEATPPFRVTRVSNYPIKYQGIYQTKHKHTSPSFNEVCFPAGFALTKFSGRDMIHLSLGENDCALKVITLDKEKLFKSLRVL